jgi:hypothetical protein
MNSNMLIKNKGITQTYIYNKNNNEGTASEIDWDYDGKQANISVNLQQSDGDAQHYDIKLDNNDLAKILSMPSVNTPIDKRLLNDFKPRRKHVNMTSELNLINDSMNVPKQSILDDNSPFYTHISSPQIRSNLVLPLDILKKRRYTKTKRRSKRISKRKSKKNRRR